MKRFVLIGLAAVPLYCGALCGCGDHTPPAPTAAPVPTGPPIFDLPSLMGKTPTQVKRMLRPWYLSNRYRMKGGDPHPGELEMVFLRAEGRFPELDLAFDGRGRCKWVMYQQPDSYDYALDQYAPLMGRLGITIDAPPDIVAPAGRRWESWHGYRVEVGGASPDLSHQKISQVQIEKTGT